MRLIFLGYALAALICAPVQQFLLGVAPAAAIGATIVAAILFFAVHVAVVNRRQLVKERREAAEIQKKLSASLFTLYLNGALDDEQMLVGSR